MVSIKNVVPQIGPIEVNLYPPADTFYKIFVNKKEEKRLNTLRHLGALSNVYAGARLARWDYTVALLYFSNELSVPKFKGNFKIGRVSFSSGIAALQLASLAWNIGHLPGTFSTEKGVYRYLATINSSEPITLLDWPMRINESVKHIIRKSNELLISSDFYALSKVLAIYKLLSWCDDEQDELFILTVDFIAPLFLNYDNPTSRQWNKLREAFKLIRHISYLTLDAPFSGESWIPNIKEFYLSQLRINGRSIYQLSAKLSELLSPIELSIYEKLYHDDSVRTETAIFAEKVANKLNQKSRAKAKKTIDNWLNEGLTRNLSLGKRLTHNQVGRVGAVRFRTHFSEFNDRIFKVEKELLKKGYTHSAIHKYHSWNSETLLEPDELIIDVIKKGNISSADIGKLLVWIIDKFDSFPDDIDDFFTVNTKLELEEAYKKLLSDAVSLNIDGVDEILFEPWPLNDFGIFSNITFGDLKGIAWASKGRIEDNFIKHIVRDRSSKIEAYQKALYMELVGIKAFRDKYRNSLRANVQPRCRWIIYTGSVMFSKNNESFLEFDGGLLKISVRTGDMTFYGLETKSGGQNPASALKKKIKNQGLSAIVTPIDTNHAYVEIPLTK